MGGKAEFRFWKNDIYLLNEVMQLPDEIICYNRLVVSGVEALCILLKRFAYPIRYAVSICPAAGQVVENTSCPAVKFFVNFQFIMLNPCLYG